MDQDLAARLEKELSPSATIPEVARAATFRTVAQLGKQVEIHEQYPKRARSLNRTD
jgi:hypothetical protein